MKSKRGDKKLVIIKDKDKLDEEIIKSGYSYRQLAKKAKCSQTQISLIMKGERNPSAQLAVKICEILNILFDKYFFISK